MSADLSLCMIVRDEAELLPGCLDSVAGLADELIVVDTGSTDDTAAIAAARGATVVHHRWTDDFAAARNVALDAATGAWILLLDADERLARGAAEAVRDALRRDDLDCGLLRLHDAATLDAGEAEVIDGRARLGPATVLPRLFRRVGDLRWQGRVHEQVDHWLTERIDRMALVPADIVHLGAVPALRVARAKSARNLSLLRARAAEEPDNPHVFAYLAAELAAAANLSDARDATDRGWAALRRVRPGVANGWVALATVRLQVLLLDDDLAAAVASFTDLEAWEGDDPTLAVGARHPNLVFLRAHLHERLAGAAGTERGRVHHLRAAALGYRDALASDGSLSTVAVEEGVTGWQARLRLAACLVQLGEHAEAEALLDTVPDGDEARHLRAECALSRRDVPAARALLGDEPHLLHGVADLIEGQPPRPVPDGPDCLRHHPAIRRALRADPDDLAPVFVGGAGRSGTTLLRAMLHAHPALHAPPELKLIPELAAQRQRWGAHLREPLRDAGVSPDLLDAACRAFLDRLLRGITPPGRRLVDKTPHDVLHIRWLARLYPRARFVHVVRDPRAVVASLLRQDWRDPATGEPVTWCTDAAAAARYWREVVDTAHAQSVFALGRVLEIRYEDLVTTPEATMRSVLASLGLPWDPAVLAHHTAAVDLPERESSSAAVRQPLHTRALSRWRDTLDAEQIAVIEAIASGGN